MTDLVSPVVALFLWSVLYLLAIDGRRSYKAMKAAREATAPQDPSGRPDDVADGGPEDAVPTGSDGG
jgi:hypothetical protein